AALTVPRLGVAAANWNSAGHHPLATKVAIIVAFVCAAICIVYMVAGLPSLRSRSRLPDRLKSEKWFLLFCWLTLNLAALLSAAYWVWNRKRVGHDGDATPALFGLSGEWIPFALFGLLIHVVGYLIARLALIRGSKGWFGELVDFVIRAFTGVA